MDVLHGAINKLTGKKPELPEKTEQSEQDYADAEAEEEEQTDDQYFASARKERDYQVSEEEDIPMNVQQVSADNVHKVYSDKVFERPEIDKSRLSKLILSSFATSNYPEGSSPIPYIIAARHRMDMGVIKGYQDLEDEYEMNKDRFYMEEDLRVFENPFSGLKDLRLSKDDVMNKTFLSMGMAGLKEMGTSTKHIKRAENVVDNMNRR